MYPNEAVGYWPVDIFKEFGDYATHINFGGKIYNSDQAVFTHPHKWGVVIFRVKALEELVLFVILGTITIIEPL